MTALSVKAAPPVVALRAVARRLADALDEAVESGRSAQAERLAASGLRLAAHSTRLADRLARLRLAQRRPNDALNIIDACAPASASMRLLRNVCLVQLGRTPEAHLDLHEWCSKSTAPLAARRLAALLEVNCKDTAAASAALARNLQQVEDPATLELLLILAVAEQRPEQALNWAQRLRAATITNPGTVDADLLCHSLGVSSTRLTQQPSQLQVQSLAVEIAAAPDAIATLVEHQETHLQPEVAQLVYQAVVRALHDLHQSFMAYEGLARLAMVLGRFTAAAHWARLGLASNPMSVRLSLILADAEAAAHVQITPQTPGSGESALGEADLRDVLGSVEADKSEGKRRAA